MPYSPSPAGNQSNYQDGQPYQIKIDQIYGDFIQQIDAVRSYINVNDTTIDKKVIDSLSGGSNQSIVNFLSPNNAYQESRCHAFFRLIGLPVSDSSMNLIYNPGFPLSPAKALGTQNTLAYKLQVAGKQIKDFRKFSITREQYPLTNATTFSSVGSISAAVLALSSGSATSTQSINLRSIDYSKVTGAFDLIAQNQTFKIGTVSLVGTNEIPLSAYQDMNGNFPIPSSSSRAHLIFPLLVDPIIDLCVNPSTRLVGLPFLPDKTYLKISSGNAYAPRPLLEKVIRDRFYSNNNVTTPLQPSQQSLISYVKTDPLLSNVAAISQVFSKDLYNISELSQFDNFVNIINEMMHQLTEALKAIHQAQSLYYWVPVMTATGPEDGVSVQSAFLPNNISSILITQRDRNLLNKIIASGLNQLNQQASQAQGVPDVGGFAFESFKTTFGSDTSSAFQDGNQLSVDGMNSTRSSILNKAGDALRMIEIIMGEFSGLGLIDIIAIMGGLYIMPQNSLIGLLDKDAFARAENSLGTAALTAIPNSYSQSMTDLFKAVTAYYAIANSILKNWTDNQGSTV